MEQRILNVLRNTFELENIDTTCSQETCEKWDSMGVLDLVVELETEFNVSLEPEEIGGMKSFKDIVRILKAKGVNA